MQICVDSRFKRDLKKINDEKIISGVGEIIQDLEQASSILKIQGLKKLKASSNMYCIRRDKEISNDRITFIYRKKTNTLELIRFLSRDKIYRKIKE